MVLGIAWTSAEVQLVGVGLIIDIDLLMEVVSIIAGLMVNCILFFSFLVEPAFYLDYA